MPSKHLTVARIGNSRGVRIPAITLTRYGIGDAVIMEEREDGILLRPIRSPDRKLSFEDTANAMAAESEDWSDGDMTVGDGLEQIPWGSPALELAPAMRVAESPPRYAGKSAFAQEPTVETGARGKKQSRRSKP